VQELPDICKRGKSTQATILTRNGSHQHQFCPIDSRRTFNPLLDNVLPCLESFSVLYSRHRIPPTAPISAPGSHESPKMTILYIGFLLVSNALSMIVYTKLTTKALDLHCHCTALQPCLSPTPAYPRVSLLTLYLVPSLVPPYQRGCTSLDP
jgi:hypothetical protein